MGHGKSSFVNSLIAPRGNKIPEEFQRRMLITGGRYEKHYNRVLVCRIQLIS